MERHAERGHAMLAGSESAVAKLAAEVAASHHERWDGTGYPNRLAGKAIPLSGRIVAVADVFDALKDQPFNSVDGQMYGVPHGWGANLLMSRTDVVTPAPDSWGAVFDPESPYKGKVTAYDSPIYIADAALRSPATTLASFSSGTSM